MNAAISDAETRPRSPDGSNVNMAGYATSWPSLSGGRLGNLFWISDNSGKVIISFILGGALGNVYDRLTYFAVPDFIDFHIGNFHWFIFNIADIFITVGVTCLILAEVLYKKDTNE